MNKSGLEAVALSVRALSIDGVQKANSGHPGLPMGCAELGAVLYGEILKHYPKDSAWADRDRFVLSAGHGSMFQYSLLHLCGYKVSKEDLMNFRQLESKTPGHPEYGETDGVETTTGPLGAGFSNGVGMAVAERMLAEKFNTEKHKVVDHYTYVLSGDGCMMEGITSEAASLAGHLGLGKLIVFYDSNSISIEGSTELAFTEDVKTRFDAYNWHTQSGDAYDMEEITSMVEKAKTEKDRPSIIILKSVIGKGSKNKEGSHDVHGAPLGEDEVKATREKLGIPADADFYIDPKTVPYVEERRPVWKKAYDAWQDLFNEWAKANPELKKEWDAFFSKDLDLHSISFPEFKKGDKLATRSAGGKVLASLAEQISNIVGGSADLGPSNKTDISSYGDFFKDNPSGRQLHFGVREHAMGGIANGMVLHGGLRVFCSTFLVFTDYMRPAIRLAALMKIPTIFVMTHDSFFVGEDGPTHQPVEHVASLRTIPNLQVLRPGDAEETAVAWAMALNYKEGPTLMALSRQNLEIYEKADSDWKHTIAKGAYIVKDTSGTPDAVIVATGSEVNLALAAAGKSSKNVRVVSMICREHFLAQDKTFRESILPPGVTTLVAEAGVRTGWECIATSGDQILSIDHFGASAPAGDLAKKFGFTPEHLAGLL